MPEMWARGAAVTIEAAAELAGVDVAAVRRWLQIGVLAAERRGDMDAVPLNQLDRLLDRYPHRERVSDEELNHLIDGRANAG